MKRNGLAGLALALTLVAVSCDMASRKEAYGEPAYASAPSSVPAEAAEGEGGGTQTAEQGRKLITTGWLTLRVKDLDEGTGGVTALMEQYAAYSSSITKEAK